MNEKYPEGSRAVIYTRISRDATGEQAGVTRQMEDCEDQAKLKRWTVVARESDNSISAYGDKERPGWERVLRLIQAGEVDVVVCYHIDRLTRNMKDLERLIILAEKHEVGVKTVSGDVDLTSDGGRMVARILAAVARQEVERKGARQKRANQDRASKGIPWASGWRSFGFELDMTQIPHEADLIRKAARDVLAGASLKSIVREWKSLGVTTPRSEKGVDGWTHNGVKSILLNPRNAGLATYRGNVVAAGAWEPIFSEETHHQLVALLTDPKRLARKTGSNGRTPQNLLSAIALCATCGETVHAGSSNGRPVYKCKAEHVSTPRDQADEIVRTAFAAVASLTLPGTVLDLPQGEDPDGILAEIDALNARQASIAGAFAEGDLPQVAWQKANEAINREKAELEKRLIGTENLGVDARLLQAEGVKKFLEMDLQTQRTVLLRLAEVTLHPRNRKRNVPIERQVSLFVKTTRGKERRLLPALVEHPDAVKASKEGASIWTEAPAPRSVEGRDKDREEMLARIRARRRETIEQ